MRHSPSPPLTGSRLAKRIAQHSERVQHIIAGHGDPRERREDHGKTKRFERGDCNRDEASQDPARAGRAGSIRAQSRPADHKTREPRQAGTREQPVRLPAQHLTKPGNESDLELEPRFLAPDYQGSGKLDRHGGARDRRRLGHRPGGRRTVCARRRGRRDRLSQRARRRGADQAARSRPKAGAACIDRGRRQGQRVLPASGREGRAASWVGSTSW